MSDSENSTTSSLELSLSEYMTFLEDIRNQPKWRAEAAKCSDYYDGKQYDTETLAALERIGMAPIIDNVTKPTINAIIGLEVKTRKDYKVSPQNRNGDFNDVADALSQKLFEAERETYSDAANSAAFKAACVPGIGWLHVGRNGDPFQCPYRYEFVPFDEMFYDMRSTKLDYSDGMYLIRSKWYDYALLKQVFKKHADILEYSSNGWSNVDINLDNDRLAESYARSMNDENVYSRHDLEWRDTNRKRARLNEVWYRRYVSGTVIKLPNGATEEYDKNNEYHRDAELQGARIWDAYYSKTRLSYWVGPHKLLDIANPYPHNQMPYIKMVGYVEDNTGVPYSPTRDMIPLQDDINARNTKASWLLVAKRVTTTDGAYKGDVNQLRKEAGRPDAVHVLDQEHMKNGGIFKVETDFQLSDQQYKIMQDKRNAIKDNVGVYAAFEGSSNNQSGVALHAATEQSSQTLATLYSNYEFAKTMAGNMLLSLIIEDIGDESQQIVVDSDFTQKKTVEINKRTPEGLSNSVYQARLNVSLNSVPTSATFRQQYLSYLQSVMQSTPPQLQAVMLKVMMKMTDLGEADKKEIVDAVDKMMGNQVQQEPKTPEEAQALKAQVEAAQRQQQMMERSAMAELELKEAKVMEARAKAEQLARASGQDVEAKIQAIKNQYEDMLIQAKQEFDTKMFEIKERSRVAIEDAQIKARVQLAIATMQSADKQEIARLQAELDQISELLGMEDSQPSDTGTQALPA